MKLSGVKCSSVGFPVNIQFSAQDKKQNNHLPCDPLVVSYNLWGNKNNSSVQFIPYFSGINNNNEIPFDHEKPNNFKVCTIDKLTCPSCGHFMLPRQIFEETFKKELDSVPESEYINVLKKYKAYMTQVEANVFEQICKQAKRNPDLGLSELLIELRDEELPKLESIQFAKLEYMKAIGTSIPKNQRYNLYQTIGNAETKIQQRTIKHPFRRKQFIEDIKKLKIHNPKTKEQLIKIAESFPSSNEAECAWIVKYSGKDKKHKQRKDREIAERFLKNATVNTDHMLARDLNGKDSIYNYMAMHSGCNSDKTNKTFMEWFNEKPAERMAYIQEYLNDVQSAIENNEIDDERYDDYTSKIIETIRKLSNGKLNFVNDKNTSYYGSVI